MFFNVTAPSVAETKPSTSTFASVDTAHEGHHEEQWSVARAVIALLAASALAAWMSETLVGAAEETGKALGMSQLFIGIVFVAIVGGAAESGSAIAMARKNKMDLPVRIAAGSCIQIAFFVAPILVLASYFVAPQPLELALAFGGGLDIKLNKRFDLRVVQIDWNIINRGDQQTGVVLAPTPFQTVGTPFVIPGTRQDNLRLGIGIVIP